MIGRARPDALLDSNVLVATLVENHLHHAPSLAVLERTDIFGFCVAAHSYAEAFTTLTRRSGPAPLGRRPDEAWAALEAFAADTRLVGLTPAQTFAAIRAYAAQGGLGPRVYDHLIGAAARAADAPAIITWNVRHLRSLFPELAVETPNDFLARTARASG